MFNQIETAETRWVNEQLELLSESQLLLANVNPIYGQDLLMFIQRLNGLTLSQINALCKDHVFNKWMGTIRKHILNSYETRQSPLDCFELEATINLLNLAIAVMARNEYRFKLPSSFSTITLLPVSAFVFSLPISKNNDRLDCLYHPDTLELEIDGTRQKLSSFRQCETIKVADQHFCFFSSPSGEEYSISFDDQIDLDAWITTLNEALSIIKKDERSSKLVKTFVSYLVPLRQHDALENLSFSARNLPNVIFKNNELTPYLVGETLVHEADHQFFYAIEKFETFWATDVKLQEPIYLSPWRDDPRPLDGILRGLSSFARVSAYYSSILTSHPFSPEEFDSVGSILLLRIFQSKQAAETVLKSNELSEFGLQYMKEIQGTLDKALSEATKHGQFENWKHRAMETIVVHKNNWIMLNHRYA